MKKSLRVIFMGTPDFAVSALKAINEKTPHDVVAVYSQPPRPKGRGKKVQKSPVHTYAETHNIPVYTPLSLKKNDDQNVFEDLKADIAIIAAYGLILPQVILDAPKFGCINIHASLLPRWRGASPIQQAIWAGDETTGISIMQMEAGLDTGPVISIQDMPIIETTTASSLHDDLSHMGGKMIIKTLEQLSDLIDGKTRLPALTQDDGLVTYAPLLKKDDGIINWTQDAQEIDQQIRALNPWPGVTTSIGETKFKILSAKLAPNERTDQPVGTIIDKRGNIACGSGSVLQIQSIQPHGKKAMDFVSAINGGYISVGDKFF